MTVQEEVQHQFLRSMSRAKQPMPMGALYGPPRARPAPPEHADVLEARREPDGLVREAQRIYMRGEESGMRELRTARAVRTVVHLRGLGVL